uniref:ATP synthase subunit a n=1 Tax=Damon diadema TaxID=317680 RepID=B5U6K3_9ARAC|nr:ATP synthase F0 subunit 6 [Damon diadema]ACI02271.1 ATP synthase F0 subunit 6 [Damon diadema]
MMSSLFSIFDPSTPPLFKMNWLSITIPVILIPLQFWLTNSTMSKLPNLVFQKLHQEMKTLSSTSFSKGTTMILISIFSFILFNNLMGLLPFIFTATSHLVVALSMALPFWVTFMLYGWINNSIHMFSHLIPLGTPPPLAIFMVCVETISNLIRPITLSVRLTANMIAGHLILTLLSNCFSLTLHKIPPIMAPELLLISLETAVAVIQAYVFTILLCLYASEIH